MEYSVYELLWFFVFYAFAGWVIGTVLAAIRERRFVDVGFLYGPWCPSYGVGGVVFAVFLSELRENLFFLFLGGVVLSFGVTLFTGFLLERVFGRRWWDYSRKRMQFGGYVNLPYTVIWGGAAVVSVCWLNPFLLTVLSLLPGKAGAVLLGIFYTVQGIDLAGTVSGLTALHVRLRRVELMEDVSENLQKTSELLGQGLVGWVQRHLARAYPNLEARALLEARKKARREREERQARAGVFAVGCSFYKLACLFLLGALLGDLTETIFCLITAGELMSRSSVVYGPFSIVWGFGCVLLTAILYQYRDYSDRYIFAFGTILGGAYEYLCSVLSELVFGTVFWDYSAIPFNLGGRINLLYCFFWGIAAVVWMKILYPRLSALIERIPRKAGRLLTWAMLIFMVFNMLISALALGRYSQRNGEKPQAETALERLLDERFPDERMERIYPNAIFVE